MQLSLTGGTFTERLIEQACRRLTPIIYNRLSSTETSIFGFTRIEGPDDRRWHRIVDGRIVQVVDDADHVLPVGQSGRIRVATEGGPNQYFGNPAASREFFKDGFFYSGDVGCFRGDGRLLLQGRNTDVLHINGHKFAPELIEDNLKKTLDVDDICVFSAPDANGDEELYVVAERQARFDIAQAREAVIQAARVEPCFRRIDAFPRTETGKIIRSRVRQEVLGLSS
jgi:acyl-coenzyme A synthetase/AMP-(fatty) acid ligase